MYAPSRYSHALIADAIAIHFPYNPASNSWVAARNDAVHSVLRYVRWHGDSGRTLLYARVERILTLAGEQCVASWDGDNYDWNYYVHSVINAIENIVNRRIEW